jgi:hypothetical protein
MSNGFRTFGFETKVSFLAWEEHKDHPNYLASIRGSAGRALAEKILADAAVYKRIDLPDCDPFGKVSHRWTVGIQTDLSEIAAREVEKEIARIEGRREAAAVCLAAASRYRRQDGGCAYVIASALEDAARAIQTATDQGRAGE